MMKSKVKLLVILFMQEETISEELRSREILPKEYSHYENEVFKSFKNKT